MDSKVCTHRARATRRETMAVNNTLRKRARVCVCVCACVRVRARTLRIVSVDKIVRFTNTLIIIYLLLLYVPLLIREQFRMRIDLLMVFVRRRKMLESSY